MTDLPSLRLDDRDLPISSLAPERLPMPAVATRDGWVTLASQRCVYGLARDASSGDLWLATAGGVLHWHADLKHYTRYAGEHGLPGAVRAVACAATGQVWALGVAGTLYALNEPAWQPYPPLAGVALTTLATDQAGRLWAAGPAGVYAIGSPATPPELALPPPPAAPRALAVAGDTPWLCDAAGVHSWDGTAWQTHLAQADRLAIVYHTGRLWLASHAGLESLDLATSDYQRIAAVPAHVTALAADANRLWVAAGRVVGHLSAAGWAALPGQLPQPAATALAPASNGVWVATPQGLLHTGPAGTHPHLSNTPPDAFGQGDAQHLPASFSNLVLALAAHSHNHRAIIWVGTPAGLYRFDPFRERWQRFVPPIGSEVRALAFAHDQLLAGGLGGLFQISFPGQPALVAGGPDALLALASGRNRHTWAATPSGVYAGDATGWKLALAVERLPGAAWPQALAEASNGRLWVGTSAGLCAYQPSTGLLELAADLPAGTSVRALLLIDHTGSEYLLAATERGLYSGPAGKLALLAAVNQAATALAWDANHQNLWVGTEHGLLRLAPAGNGWALQATLTPTNSGLASERITALAITADEQSTTIWVGTPGGLNTYRP